MSVETSFESVSALCDNVESGNHNPDIIEALTKTCRALLEERDELLEDMSDMRPVWEAINESAGDYPSIGDWAVRFMSLMQEKKAKVGGTFNE